MVNEYRENLPLCNYIKCEVDDECIVPIKCEVNGERILPIKCEIDDKSIVAIKRKYENYRYTTNELINTTQYNNQVKLVVCDNIKCESKEYQGKINSEADETIVYLKSITQGGGSKLAKYEEKELIGTKREKLDQSSQRKDKDQKQVRKGKLKRNKDIVLEGEHEPRSKKSETGNLVIEESKRKMLEIISCADNRMLNVFKENEKLRNLIINASRDVPLSHTIETRISSCPTKDQEQQFRSLNITLRNGTFTIDEDEKIKENFKQFCMEHELNYDAKPFLRFQYGQDSILKKQDRIKFGRYLGKGLANRKLYCIYNRFKILYSSVNKGRFTPEEDTVILIYMEVLKFSNHQFAELSKILNRPRPNIERRYKLLQETGRTLKPNDYTECVKYLMKITGFDNLQSIECENENYQHNANEAINTNQCNGEIELVMCNDVKCESEENQTEINTEVDETIIDQTSVMEGIGCQLDEFQKIEREETSEGLNQCNKGKNTDSLNNNGRKRKRMRGSKVKLKVNKDLTIDCDKKAVTKRYKVESKFRAKKCRNSVVQTRKYATNSNNSRDFEAGSVYKRLRVPYSSHKRRCTPQEDAVILRCMKVLKSSSRPLAELSKILNRFGFSIGKRCKGLRRKFRQPLKPNNCADCNENEDKPKFKKTCVAQTKKCITATDCVSDCEFNNDSENKESKRKILEIVSNANSTMLNIFEKNEKIRQLTVNITWNVPPSHTIETRISSCPTKKQQQQFLNLGIKFITGPFTIQEDETIKENFKHFCVEHGLEHNPTPFLCLRYGQASILNKEERVKFGRYLGRSLDNRKLHCIYTRFKVLYSTLKKGRYTSEEDAMIMEFMEVTGDKSKHFSTLSKILNRPRSLIEKRFRILQRKTLLLKPHDYPRLVKSLIEATSSDNLEELRDKRISDEEWHKVAIKLHLCKNHLKKCWMASLYTKLFHKGPIDVDKIMRKLIANLDKLEKDDYRKLNWTELAKPFRYVTHGFLYRMFKKTKNRIVPLELRSNLRKCVLHLKQVYEEEEKVMPPMSNIVLQL